MRRTRAQWRDVVDRQRSSGLSVSEFCRREKTTENSFYRWRRIFAEEAESSFVPVAVVDHREVEVGLPCGATVKITADRELLREVFAALLSVEANDA
jgi:transposase-like protein